ncbi:glucose 1-dehydrogenase [Actinomadura viridis]|uniref:2-hydroxycyclohexanecarboxyl-CoA dehydrogenase n=1 Tax=Actinomadura viridis TaxID=58110 RepID=A0A931GMY4_9ACTN|nr:SDR family NAD(P)-dependent oxidoreductase [Actinomadura viridis]MBG6093167.1 2-hydroxycyclohexanecarboxyl-CoA dehydrogenase [Actinomadura viridis]
MSSSSQSRHESGFHGTAVVVTGGAKGIGAAIVRRLGASGASVAVVDLDTEAAEALAREVPGAFAVRADVGDYAGLGRAMDDACARMDGLDVLINNAGWDHVRRFTDTDPALWDKLIHINLKGVLNATHLALPRLVERGGGRIVNVASDAGRVGSSGEAVYAACKGGTIAFTKSIARETARRGIAVNCVCPGPTDTPLLEEIKRDDRAAATMDAIVRATPTRRPARPEEIAEAVAFFAAAPAHITGQVLSVSGGLSMVG